MKWILAIFLFISIGAIAQPRPDDSTKYIWYQNQYGLRQPRIGSDSFFYQPYGDTTGRRPYRNGAKMMHLDGKEYKWNNGLGWNLSSSTPTRFGIEDNTSTVNRRIGMQFHDMYMDSIGIFNLHSHPNGAGENSYFNLNGEVFMQSIDTANGHTHAFSIGPDVVNFSAIYSNKAPRVTLNNTDSLKIASPSSIAAWQNDTLKAVSMADLTSLVSGATPGGSAGGDLTGTYPNPTIASNAVTNAKAAQMAAHTFKGNNTGSTANASDLTATQLTAELNVFGASTKGLVPAAAASPSSSKYLSEDGTFTIPSGSGGEANTASNQGSGVGVFKTKSGVDLQFKSITTPASVAATSNTNDVALQLVNDESTPSRWKFYGTDINDSSKGFKEIEENFVGILYNKNSWSNLNDFTTQMVTASIVSNKIQITPATAGIYSCNVIINNLLDSIAYTNLQKWKATMRVTVDVKNGTSYGFGIGMKSYNNYGKFNGLGRFGAYTGGGELYLSGGQDSVTLNTSSRKLSFSQGDKVLLTVERDGGYLTTNIRNLTTNSTAIDTSYYYSYTSAPYMPNTGKFSVFAFGGQFTIDSICISSNEVKNARAMVAGNSKSQGYQTSGYAQTFPAMLNNNYKTTVLHAGGSDRTIDIARTLPEILMQRPQQIILADVMSNDFRQGAESSATIYARYDSITNVLLAAGIDVYHAPLYESSLDLSGVLAHIASIAPANKILPTYPVMQLGGNLAGDGIHPSDAGNLALYNAIVQSYKLYGGNNRYGSSSGGQAISGNSNFIPKFLSSAAIGNSNLSDDGVRINSALSIRTPAVTYYHSGAATDAKNWNIQTSSGNLSIVAVNDAGSVANTVMNFTRSGATPGTVTLNAPLTVNPSSGPAFVITPAANDIGAQITGTVSGYYIPTNYNVNASGGLFGNYINSNSGSSAHAEIALATAGSGSGSPFVAFRNSNTNNEYTVGHDIATGAFKINNGTFPAMGGGNNLLKITSAGAITFNNAYTFPTADGSSGQVLSTNGSGSVSFQTLVLKGSTTWDPASIADNSSTTTTVTVTGAALGDPVTISKTSGSYSNGEVYFAYVSGTNTVTIQLQNVSGGTFDIASATYNVVVLKY